MTKPSKKLIEVALPLPAINEGSKPETENPFLKGHPRGVHNWWARTPLSVCRAILFSQLIDDPGDHHEFDTASKSRRELVDLVGRLATWDATTDPSVIDEARAEISRQFDGNPPPFWDMFSGRGSISIEAQRLGLQVFSSDLNPVAVTIQKALLQYPQRFAGCPPVNFEARSRAPGGAGSGASGLIEDILHYGKFLRNRAEARIGHLYPKITVTEAMTSCRNDLKPIVGKDLSVVALLWARAVASPNPTAKGKHVPLVSSFVLSSKKGKEAIVVPVIENGDYRFTVKSRCVSPGEIRQAKSGTKAGRGANFTCLLSKAPLTGDFIKAEGIAGRMSVRLMAVVAEGPQGGRIYLEPTEAMEAAAASAEPSWRPRETLPSDTRAIWCPLYGLTTFADLFTDRQLVTLGAFSELVDLAREKVLEDALAAGMDPTAPRLTDGGNGAHAYADAVATYLACALSRMVDYHCALATWNSTNGNISHLFQRQAIPMAWDFAESNPLRGKLDYTVAVGWVADSLRSIPAEGRPATVFQHDAKSGDQNISGSFLISTDPPYYDNIGYADLSDFFYVWLRRTLGEIDPKLFRTILTPKSSELVASPHRHNGSTEAAGEHFRRGFVAAFDGIRKIADSSVPVTLYYAFKQSEAEAGV